MPRRRQTPRRTRPDPPLERGMLADTLVSASWTLTPTDAGTHVAFCHSGLSGVMGWVKKRGLPRRWERMMARSLPYVLEVLAREDRFPSREDVKVHSGK